MIVIATLAFFLIVVAWMVAPNGAAPAREPESAPGIVQADATA